MEERFNASDLDSFINEIALSKGDVKQLDQDSQPIVIASGADEGQPPATYNTENIYAQISQLVDTGNRMLKTAQYALEMDPLAEGGASGAASVLNAVKDVTKEFTKIHFQNLKHMQSIELERIKQENRERLLQIKLEAMKGTMKQAEQLVPYCQEDVVKMILNADAKDSDEESDVE